MFLRAAIRSSRGGWVMKSRARQLLFFPEIPNAAICSGSGWNRLHRLVYVAAICGVVHYLWLVKADLRGPAIYAGILALLLVARVVHALRPRPVRAARR